MIPTPKIKIDAATCVRCGRCAEVCPSLVIVRTASDARPEVVHPENCCSCGHCLAICPAEAIRHDDYPAGSLHPVDRNALPTPEQLLLLCRARRSNRAFSKLPVPHEHLDRIIEAAHRAPTASNRQQVAFTLITDPERLRFVSRFTLDTFASIARRLEHPLLRPLLRPLLPNAYRYLPAFHRMIDTADRGHDMILRGATALLLIHTPTDNAFGVIDSNLAYQNGSLMAESLGVAQFWTGFVYMALRHGDRKRFGRTLGIPGTVHAGMALGMPRYLFPRYMDRRPVDLTER